MLRRMFFTVIMAVLAGCSEGSDPVGVPPQSKAEAEKKSTEDEEPEPGGIEKCRIYRTPECRQPIQ
jgi:hypothetical protein